MYELDLDVKFYRKISVVNAFDQERRGVDGVLYYVYLTSSKQEKNRSTLYVSGRLGLCISRHHKWYHIGLEYFFCECLSIILVNVINLGHGQVLCSSCGSKWTELCLFLASKKLKVILDKFRVSPPCKKVKGPICWTKLTNCSDVTNKNGLLFWK